MSSATFVTYADARPHEHVGHGSGKMNRTRGFFGTAGTTAPGPQAFLVHDEPGTSHRAHFHHVDQFQLFFGAPDTTFQRHETGPLLLHYADADTLYGPFGAGEQPYTFMTLRRNGTQFTGHMPDDKEEMSHGRAKRHYSEDLQAWLANDYLADGEFSIDSIFDPHDDNLAAFTIAAAPGAKFALPSAPGSGGQYYVVVDGEASYGDSELSKYTIGWADPDDEPAELVAGDDGARLVVLQFGVEHAD